jgi:hypothetical protein
MTQNGIKGGWGCEHWKIKAWSVMEHGHKPKIRTKTNKCKRQWSMGIDQEHEPITNKRET